MSNYYICAIVVVSLICLLIVICSCLSLYERIYYYVCEQLDRCNYFGENK